MQPEVPCLRGSVIKSSYEFLEKSFGASFLRRVMERIPIKDQEALRPPFLPLSWYPVESVQKWHAAYESEITAIGKNPDELKIKMRNELGGVFRSVYSVIFSLFNPASVIARLPLITERVYNCIQTSILENQPGSCLLEYRGPSLVHQYFRATLLDGLIFVLELGGVHGIKNHLEKDTITGEEFTLRVRLTYKT